MNAYEAMVAVLDVNETTDQLKQRYNNTDSQIVDFTGAQDLTKAVDLLAGYRNLLIAVMKATTLEVFKSDDK